MQHKLAVLQALADARCFLALRFDGNVVRHIEQMAFLLLALPGLFALYAYFWHSQRHPHALFSRTLFKNSSFRIGIIGNLIARLGSGALPFLTPLFLQVALGFSPTHAGLTMMPIALGAMSTKLLANRIVLRFATGQY